MSTFNRNRMTGQNPSSIRLLPGVARRFTPIAALTMAVACSNSPTRPSDVPETFTSAAGASPSVHTAEGERTIASLSAPGAAVVSQGQLIMQQAERYVNMAIAERCNCKEFARRIVREASSGKVYLPATSSNSYEWNLPAFGVEMFATVKPSSPRPIYGVDSGDVIQMVSRKSGLAHGNRKGKHRIRNDIR